MPITGSQPALEYARAGVASGSGLFAPMRVGASRSGYYNPFLALTISGTRREHQTDISSVTINDVLLEEVNTCELDVFGFTPVIGQPVVVGLGSISNVLFAGTITRIRESHPKLNARVVYHCTATDWSYLLDKRLVTYHWRSTSASQIAIEIIHNFTDASDGLKPTRVQTGIASVDDFPCTFETVSNALTRLARLAGGYWYVDDTKVVHFFTGTEAGTVAPIALDSSNTEFRGFTYEQQLDQVRTKVYVEGMQTSLLADCFATGMTIPLIPVQSVEGFNTIAGGLVRIDQLFTLYTSVIAAGGGSTTTGTVAVGAASIAVADTSAFRNAGSGGGWAQLGGSVFYYSDKSVASGAGSLTGIPASGPGSITASQGSGAGVDTVPMLQLSGVQLPIGTLLSNAEVVLVEVSQDSAAETALAAVEGGDGSHQFLITDGRLDYHGAAIRATAETLLYASPLTSINYTTKDQRVRSGLEVSLSIAAWSLSGTFRIQQVQIQFRPDRPWPDRTVLATSQRRDLYGVLQFLSRSH
jgi:hypothetical protein